MDICCCNDEIGLRLRMAAVAMDAQGIRAVILRLGQRYVLEAMESPRAIKTLSSSSGEEPSCYEQAHGILMSSEKGLCIIRSMVIADCAGLLAFVMDTHRGF